MLRYWKNLNFNFRMGVFLISNGILLIAGAFLPFLPLHRKCDIHTIINKAAFLYFSSYPKK
tara:strand:+ start:777 stop:959 length:183 start_codon:yes stop_codon:yes gene_type:complete